MHENRMSTLHSESESVAGESLVNVAEECMADPLDDEAASSILSLDMISVEQQPVSPATQYARVNEYLVQMSETSAAAFQVDDTSVFDVMDTTLQNVDIEQDEVDSSPFHVRSHPDQAAIESGLPEVQQFDLPEDGAVPCGFEPSQSFDDHPDNADLDACGGVVVDECDAGSGCRQGRRADRSKLRLDIPERQEDVPLHSEFMGWLDPEEAEELLAFVAEFEEAFFASFPKHPWHLDAPRQGCSITTITGPEAAEIARILACAGDKVQQQHFAHLGRAVGRLMLARYTGIFTYQNFREAAMMVLERDLSEWKQVGIILLCSQWVALRLAHHRGLHRVINHTVHQLANTAADFIIRQGGWMCTYSLFCS